MQRIHFPSIDSTNAEARRRLIAGDMLAWAAISADEQTAGRGRRERAWASPPGNLHVSFIVPKDDRPAWRRPWLVGFAAALAVADTARVLVDDPRGVRLKWPNDVLVAGMKVAGLLVEGVSDRPAVIVGIGVNVASAPEATATPATALDRHRPAPVAVSEVLNLLSDYLLARIEAWADGDFPALRADYLALGHGPGDRLRVRAGEGVEGDVVGHFRDIDADGCLILDVEGRDMRFSTGDVFAVG